MPRTVSVSATIDADLKHSAESILEGLGLSPSQAITWFYQQVRQQGDLPGAGRIPNETTRRAMEEARARRNLQSFNSVDELFEDLEV